MAVHQLLPETRDTQRAWKNISLRCADICKNKDNVSPSQLSQLMGELHKVLLVSNFVDENQEEKALIQKVRILLMLVTPLHTKMCNGELDKITELEWEKLERFIRANSF